MKPMSPRFSRRRFLKGSGALIVSFGAMRLTDVVAAAQGPTVVNRLDGAGSNQVDGWLAVAEDGRVTAYVGKCEFGQGLFTAQTQLVAEELYLPVTRVSIIQCDTMLCPDQGTTSGSQSHPTNFNQGNLALAAATAREALLGLASTRLGVPVGQLTIRDGVISVRNDATKSVPYGALIGGKRFNLTLSKTAVRKPQREWTVLGTPVKRIELPALVTGRFEHLHNVRLPGMLHGRVVRPPTVGATLVKVDESSVQSVPGLVKVVVKGSFIGVVAEKPWQAMQAAAQLKADWKSGPPLPSHETYYAHLRNQKPTRETRYVDSGDVPEKLAQAAQVVRTTYHHPFQMHGSIGSSCSVADVQGGKVTAYSASQAVWAQQVTVGMLLGIPTENVRIIYRMGSGCYGINGADTVTYDAALLSQAVGKPVRVQLTRKDEMAWENYGVPKVIEQRVGLDAKGQIVAWDVEAWSAARGGRPGNSTPMAPGSVITGLLAGFQAPPFQPRSPAPPPKTFENAANDSPSYVMGRVGGERGGTGTVASERVLIHVVPSPFWTGPLRSPNRLQNTFAHEGTMDEIAARVKADPVQYRLRHLSDKRLIAVVNAAAKAASWRTRPSPAPRRRGPVASGRGFACMFYEGDNGYGAMVAEVDVNENTGQVLVKRIVMSQDCGPISNPDGMKNQAEGGALQGMSRALLEEVTWDDQKVTSVDWRTYSSLSLGDPMPEMTTVLINQSEGKAMGAGEVSITLSAAAIGNAIFDATGVRIREVPFTPERVKAALKTRT